MKVLHIADNDPAAMRRAHRSCEWWVIATNSTARLERLAAIRKQWREELNVGKQQANQ